MRSEEYRSRNCGIGSVALASIHPRTTLQQLLLAKANWRQRLQGWAASGELAKPAQSALNRSTEPALRTNLCARPAKGVFEDLPPVLEGGSLLASSRGAYGWETATIDLNDSWLQSTDDTSIIAMLNEELGQHLDAILNLTNSPGDKGARLTPALMEPTLSAPSHQALLKEDNRELPPVDGTLIQVEFSDIVGTPGDDKLQGTDDAVLQRDLEGNDCLTWQREADQPFGEANNDTLNRGNGSDILRGSGGRYRLNTRPENVRTIGCVSDKYHYSDRLHVAMATKGTHLSTLPANPLANDVYVAIQDVENSNIQASEYHEIFCFSAADANQRVSLYEHAGHDDIAGEAANDTLISDYGNFSLNGGRGYIQAGLGNVLINGSDGNNALYAAQSRTLRQQQHFSSPPCKQPP
jgi:hypothetical protein